MRTPAEFADASFERVMAKDKAGWIELFTDDAFARDPVGPSPHDPDGKGFRGKAQIAKLWDTSIATFTDIRFVVRERYVGDTECATLFTVYLTPTNGADFALKGIAIHKSNGEKMYEFCSYLTPATTKFGV